MSTLTARGSIIRSRFVKLDTTDNESVVQSDLNAKTIGIAQQGAQNAPIPSETQDPPYAATTGRTLWVHRYNHGENEAPRLQIGTGGCTAGDLLKSDANGKGIVAQYANIHRVGAIALETAAVDELAKVQIIPTTEYIDSQVETVAGAGTVQGDAAAITRSNNIVTGADGTVGVILPELSTLEVGTRIEVYNSVATNGLKIYPAVGDDINDGTTDAAITIEGKTTAYFVATDSGTWAAQYTANT